MRPARATVGNGFARLAGACLLLGLLPRTAHAFDRFTLTYGLRESLSYTDNLNAAREGEAKIADGAINTAPDLSLLYDDGETRWLVRGSFRRERLIENSEASGKYFAFGGEFSRALTDKVTFSLLGGYTNDSSTSLGGVLQEPGQRRVARAVRDMPTEGTFWSPSLSVFWSRRFGTTLTYADSQSFTEGSLGKIDRTLSLNGFYVLNRSTVLKGVIVGFANRNVGLPMADKSDVNSLVARFGFVHTFSPRLSMDFSAGPQWTRDVNLPRNVTLLRNAIVETVVDPVFGLTEPLFVKEPGRRVDALSLGFSFSLQVGYQLSRHTSISILAAQGSTSDQGVTGAQQTQDLQVSLTRALSSKWGLAVRAAWTRTTSIEKDFSILFTPDPMTGEIQALDDKSFDIDARMEQRQITFEPRLSYRIKPWLSAYTSWNWTELRDQINGDVSRVNRVEMGIEFRKDAYY